MLYIFDSNEKLAAILRNEGTSCPFFNAVHSEQLNGINTFSFACPGDHSDAQYVIEGNFVAFRDIDQDFQMFQIVRIEEFRDETGPVKAAFCEHVALELLDEIIEDKRPYGVSAQFALMVALEGTRWQVGEISNLGQNSVNFYYESVLSAIQKILNTWGGEVRYRIRIENNQITGRYVDILDRRGADRGKLFIYGKDLINARRTIDSSNVKTALYGRGKGEETGDGYGRRITFADVEWSKAAGDQVDKPLGQEWVGDPVALAQWGRAGGTRHRFGIFEDPDITDPAELLQKTWEELQKLKEPLVSYEATVADLEQIKINEKYYYDTGLQYDTGLLYYEAIQAIRGFAHEVIRLGDTVRVIDKTFRPALKLQARIIELRRNLTEPEKTEIVLGNFLPLITDEGQRLRKIEARLNDRQGIWDDKLKPGDKIQTDWLEGIIDVLKNQLVDTAGYVYTEPGGGLIILDRPRDDNVNPPTKALLLKGGVFAIANSKNQDGSWKWRTFGDGNGFTADLINAGTLNAALVNILGGNYVTIDGNGIHVVDPLNNERVRLGQIGTSKYGIKVTEGELYSTYIQTGGEGSDTYIALTPSGNFEAYYNGNRIIFMQADANEGRMSLSRSGVGETLHLTATYGFAGGEYSAVLAQNPSDGLVLIANPNDSYLQLSRTGVSNFRVPFLNFDFPNGMDMESNGEIRVFSNFRVIQGYSKNMLMFTENYGERLLYAYEMPEPKFADEGIAELVNGECIVQIDPIFLETIEPLGEDTPYIVHLTPYDDMDIYVDEITADCFIVKERNGKSGKFAWTLSAVMKGCKGIRLERNDEEDLLNSNWEDELGV